MTSATPSHSFPADYVGFWPRTLATLADAVLVAAIVTPLLVIVYGPGYLFDEQLIEGAWHVVIGICLPAIAALWFLAKFQATPGKLMLHAQIIDARTGNKPSLRQFVLRYLSFMLISLPALGLGCLWVGWDERKQGWHDKLAGTIVVRRADWHPRDNPIG